MKTCQKYIFLLDLRGYCWPFIYKHGTVEDCALCILVVQIPSAEMEERIVAMTRPYNCKNLTQGSSIINYAQLSSVFKLIKCWLYTYIYIYTSENHTILLSVNILNRDGGFFLILFHQSLLMQIITTT